MARLMYVILFMTLAASCLSQVPFLGHCPDLKTVENFDLQRYFGKWYEAERYFAVFEFAGKCVTTNYTEGSNSTVSVVNRLTSSLTGVHSSVEGVGIADENNPSKLSVKFTYVPAEASYWVLDTDYDNYSVVWSCTDFTVFNARNAWVLTRARYPTLETMEKAYGILDKNNVSRAFFIRTDQKNCPDDY